MKILTGALGGITSESTGEAWQVAEFAEQIAIRAARLRGLGIAPRDKLLIAHGGSAEFFADLLACWQIGACAICVNPLLTDPEFRTVLDFAAPRLTVLSRNGLASWRHTNRAVALSDACMPSIDVAACDDGASRDDPALMLFTSGTTGQPKGVVHSFRSLLARLSLNRNMIPAEDRVTTLCPLPTHFGHGLIGNALTPLLAGGELILVAGGLQTAGKLGELIDRHNVTFMSSVPAFWKIVIKVSPPPKKMSLRRIHVGSAPLSAALWHEIIRWSGIRNVVNMYGITETANWIGGASALDHEPADGMLGRVWGGHAAILTEKGGMLTEGEGEILIQTPSLMSGYHNRPDLTEQVLSGGWLRTGDIGRLSTDGVLRMTGRIKHEINRAGLKVHPEDIDLLLERSDMVKEACAFAVQDELAGETVGLAVVPADPATFDLERLKKWCGERLVPEKQPQKWYVVNEIHKNERGKINRADVARACLAQ